MQNGYLIAKCLCCGSTIFLKIRGVKGRYSQCPVCSEYALSIVEVQPCMLSDVDTHWDISTLPDYVLAFLENASN